MNLRPSIVHVVFIGTATDCTPASVTDTSDFSLNAIGLENVWPEDAPPLPPDWPGLRRGSRRRAVRALWRALEAGPFLLFPPTLARPPPSRRRFWNIRPDPAKGRGSFFVRIADSQ